MKPKRNHGYWYLTADTAPQEPVGWVMVGVNLIIWALVAFALFP